MIYNFVILLFLFVVQACTNPTSTTVVSTDEIRGTKSYGDKFINENGWIIFRLDGTWESQLDGSLACGTWRRDGTKLYLSNIRSSDGKGKIYLREYNLIEWSDERLVMVDSEGERIEMDME